MRDYVIALLERHMGLGRYKFSGESNISLKCPFHKGGQEHGASFSVNVDQGLFQCFTCKVAGTIPHLLRLLGVPPSEIDAETKDLRVLLDARRHELDHKRRREWLHNNPLKTAVPLRESMLKAYEWCPTRLTEKGFDSRVLQYMEVGVDIHNKRITYPVRDIYGTLAGIVGGATYDGQVPKYKVYEGKRKDPRGNVIPSDFGTWFDEDPQYRDYVFHNHEYLWGFDRVYPRLFFGKEVETLIIVEGFKACLWLLQHGYWNTVALMGSAMSLRQSQLLGRLHANVVLFLDNNEAGIEGTKKVGRELDKKMPGVKVATYPSAADTDAQPDNFNEEQLRQILSDASSYPKWMSKKGEGKTWVFKV